MQSLILREVSKLKSYLGPLMFNIDIKNVTDNFDAATNSAFKSETVNTYNAVIEEFTGDENDQWGVRVDDLKVIIVAQGVVIDTNFEAVVNNVQYQILRVKPIYVGNIIAVTIVHLRR